MDSFPYPSRNEIGEILKDNKTIAVVGLSDNPERTSYQVSSAMQEAGYKIIPVNPKAKEVLGERAYASLKDVNEPFDIVNVFRRSEHLPAVAKEAVETDANIFWAQLGLENEEAYNIAKEAGMTVIMNRCIKVEHALTK
ncbi:CoA-binding protein [Alteribacillus iranensis]|uniref:Predicted CoA-binding protein n=1 Tax=Alteribacillus iranensis TaxID=930128 RepID=A0A1I1ZY94_9BACI|nr:CoA-binding protein [Alteribacillus iranensis]SFE36635.1 Predicted CoA-binding protein [Alteribacillus iranensis]